MALHSRSGQTVLNSLSIQPQEKLAVDLRKFLVDLATDPTGDFAEGSVTV